MLHTLQTFITNPIIHDKFAVLSIILIFSFFIFLTSWLIEPRRLINGCLFTIFLLFVFSWIAIFVDAHHNLLLRNIFIFIIIAVVFIILLLITFSWIFLLWNAYFVWKYESHTLPNMLTLILGLVFGLIWVLNLIDPLHRLPQWIQIMLSSIPLITIYLGVLMYNYLINSLLYQFVPYRHNQDYLIVLGAGLKDGKQVTPLLASRINRAIKFAQKQYQITNHFPKFIMSGGKGSDEQLSEARAMANYAIDQGIPKNLILLEDKSINTYQNMLYSKKIAINDFGGNNFKAKFFSNNYHIFRAGLNAKKVNLAANGIGVKTRFYYLPNAIIREFAGVFVMHKRRHFIIIGLISLIFILFGLLVLFKLINY